MTDDEKAFEIKKIQLQKEHELTVLLAQQRFDLISKHLIYVSLITILYATICAGFKLIISSCCLAIAALFLTIEWYIYFNHASTQPKCYIETASGQLLRYFLHLLPIGIMIELAIKASRINLFDIT